MFHVKRLLSLVRTRCRRSFVRRERHRSPYWVRGVGARDLDSFVRALGEASHDRHRLACGVTGRRRVNVDVSRETVAVVASSLVPVLASRDTCVSVVRTSGCEGLSPVRHQHPRALFSRFGVLFDLRGSARAHSPVMGSYGLLAEQRSPARPDDILQFFVGYWAGAGSVPGQMRSFCPTKQRDVSRETSRFGCVTPREYPCYPRFRRASAMQSGIFAAGIGRCAHPRIRVERYPVPRTKECVSRETV